MTKRGQAQFIGMMLAVMMIAIFFVKNFLPMVAAVGIIGMIIFINRPNWAFFMFIVLLPYSATSLFVDTLGGITGVKLFNIISLICVISFLFGSKKNKPDKLELTFMVVYLSLFVIAILRCLPYIAYVSVESWKTEYQFISFIQAFALKPIMYFYPFIAIVLYYKNTKELKTVIHAVIFSLFGLSMVVLYIYLFVVTKKSDFELTRKIYESILVMHGNEVANFYIFAFPIMVVYLCNKTNIFVLLAVFNSILAIALLYSRTAYTLIILSSIIFFIVSKRTKFLPLFAAGLIIMVLMMPSTVIERAMYGTESGDLNDLSAGRTDNIWYPLASDLLRDPKLLLFGGGRYYTPMMYSYPSMVYRTGHGHNLFLDTTIDTGLVGLIIYLSFFVIIIRKLYLGIALVKDRFHSEMLYGIIMSVSCFIIRGMTDDTFFPTKNNNFVWLFMGLGLTIIKVSVAAQKEEAEKNATLQLEGNATVSLNRYRSDPPFPP